MLLKGDKDEGFDAQEILCDFLGKVPAECDIKVECDPQVMKEWERDSHDNTKVTLTYMTPDEEGDFVNPETFVPAKFREAEPA